LKKQYQLEAYEEIGEKLTQCIEGKSSDPLAFAEGVIQFLGWFNARGAELKDSPEIDDDQHVKNIQINMLDKCVEAWNDIYDQKKDVSKNVEDVLLECLQGYHDWIVNKREELEREK
jgi:hypothetical protein